MSSDSEPASETRPLYTKQNQEKLDGSPSGFYMVLVDEGWRQSILGCDMYEWAADWLIELLDRQPFAPKHRPQTDSGR